MALKFLDFDNKHVLRCI